MITWGPYMEILNISNKGQKRISKLNIWFILRPRGFFTYIEVPASNLIFQSLLLKLPFMIVQNMSAPWGSDRAWRRRGTANEDSWENSDLTTLHRLGNQGTAKALYHHHLCRRKALDPLTQWHSACGSPPLWGRRTLSQESPKTTGNTDTYIMVHNSSRVGVMK